MHLLQLSNLQNVCVNKQFMSLMDKIEPEILQQNEPPHFENISMILAVFHKKLFSYYKLQLISLQKFHIS